MLRLSQDQLETSVASVGAGLRVQPCAWPNNKTRVRSALVLENPAPSTSEHLPEAGVPPGARDELRTGTLQPGLGSKC